MATSNEKKLTSAAKEAREESDENKIETMRFTVNLRGRDYELEVPKNLYDADPEVYIAYEEEKVTPFLKALLGTFQWNTLRRAGLRASDIGDIYEAWMEAGGEGED